ncbi:MAG: glycosyltransferase family 4 protein [Ruminococcaceae bacterium]|nr:glycosyltransferase family 4 protein [Oscillospiraceae bacterium]
MKILKLSSYCYPEQVASSHLSKDMNEAYEKSGIICEVYAPTPCRGIDEQTRKKYKKIKYEEINNGHIRIHRYSMFKEPKNPVLRAFRYTLCILRGFICGLFAKDIDIFSSSSTPPINGLVMYALKKVKKYKTVYSLQDIFPDSLVNAKMTKKGSVLWKIGRFVENITYKSADRIIVISEDFKRNIMEKGVSEDKIDVVYNWVNEQKVVNIDREDNKLFDKYNLERDKFYICYSGNIGLSQNMEMLTDVAKELEKNEDIRFVIIGEGAFKESLLSIIEEKQVKNITVLPFQDYEDISHVFSLGDAGLIISKKGIGSNSVPSKTWSIMSASRPVIASFDKGSEFDSIITENNCGICVEADDKEALIKAVLYMYENKDEIKKMGENGRRFILENLTKEIGTGKSISILRKVYSQK